jgi:hypothetical protein
MTGVNLIKLFYSHLHFGKIGKLEQYFRRHDTHHNESQHNDIQDNDTHHNDIQDNDTQHKRLTCDTQHK